MRNLSVISHHHTDYIVSSDQNTVSWTKHMLSLEITCKKHPWSRTLNGLTNSLFRKQHTCVPIHQNNGPFTDLRNMVLWHTSFNLHPFVVNLVRLVIGQGSLAIRLESSGWWWIKISKQTNILFDGGPPILHSPFESWCESKHQLWSGRNWFSL